eukprot:6904063-Prymnesium_polylepis.2
MSKLTVLRMSPSFMEFMRAHCAPHEPLIHGVHETVLRMSPSFMEFMRLCSACGMSPSFMESHDS